MTAVSLNLENVYTLADLLNEAGRLMTTKEVRKVLFVFSEEKKWSLECTDARTNRIRYVQAGQVTETMAYWQPTEISEAIDTFFTDLKLQISKSIAGDQSAMKRAQLQLFMGTEKTPMIFLPQASGYRYEKQTSPST